MSITQYLEYAIRNGFLYKLNWITSLLGVRLDNTENDYIKIEDGVGYVKVDSELIKFDSYIKGGAFLRISDEVIIPKDLLKSLNKVITTTIGKLIINHVLIEKPFNGSISYMDGDISFGDIMDVVRVSLSDDIITVAQYRDFVLAATYIEGLNTVVTPSSTAKLLVAPPGLKKFKSGLKKSLVSKHGEGWQDNPIYVVEYDTALKAYYADYIKDDPSDGIMANNKNKNNALAKKYLTFSTASAFGEQTHIDESLSDGYPDDPAKLAALFNTARAASYSRGAETQKGGAVAKSVLRATSSMFITDKDCGVKYGKHKVIDKDNVDNMVGRYIIENSKVLELTNDNISSYINKSVILRSPMYCIAKSPSLCPVCLGRLAASRPNGISLIVTNISSVLTKAALKVMHNSQISATKISLDDMLT
jgi:hypothetical protein